MHAKDPEDKGHWVLVVVYLLKHAIGFTFKLFFYNSGEWGEYATSSKSVIWPVKEYLRILLPKQEFYDWEQLASTCAKHEKACDSGIAVIENIISIAHPDISIATDMSELACWERREKYAWQFLESARANLKTIARGKLILTTMARAPK